MNSTDEVLISNPKLYVHVNGDKVLFKHGVLYVHCNPHRSLVAKTFSFLVTCKKNNRKELLLKDIQIIPTLKTKLIHCDNDFHTSRRVLEVDLLRTLAFNGTNSYGSVTNCLKGLNKFTIAFKISSDELRGGNKGYIEAKPTVINTGRVRFGIDKGCAYLYEGMGGDEIDEN